MAPHPRTMLAALRSSQYYKAKVKEDRKENPKADKQAHNALMVKAKEDENECKRRKVIYVPDSDGSSSS
jgi:hypothetical protein